MHTLIVSHNNDQNDRILNTFTIFNEKFYRKLIQVEWCERVSCFHVVSLTSSLNSLQSAQDLTRNYLIMEFFIEVFLGYIVHRNSFVQKSCSYRTLKILRKSPLKEYFLVKDRSPPQISSQEYSIRTATIQSSSE